MNIGKVRVAVFGESGSGKTVLLSTFYGINTKSEVFLGKSLFLSISKEQAQIGRRLLANHNRISQSVSFPPSTDDFTIYNFRASTFGSNITFLDIDWYDYPGGFWLVPEKIPRDLRVKLKQLIQCDVGILIIDGERFSQEGKKYVKRIFSQFNKTIARLKKEVVGWVDTMQRKSLPKHWIIALSKADSLDESFSAEEFYKFVFQCALTEMEDLGKTVNSPQFGDSFLLLSAARRVSTDKFDGSSPFGFDLIIPSLFENSIRSVVKKANPNLVSKFRAEVSGTTTSIIRFVERVDITGLLQALRFGDASQALTEHLRGSMGNKEIEAETVAKALAEAMRRFNTTEGKRLYYTIQNLF